MQHCVLTERWGCGANVGDRSSYFNLTITGGKIVAINVIADPEHLRQMELVILESSSANL